MVECRYYDVGYCRIKKARPTRFCCEVCLKHGMNVTDGLGDSLAVWIDKLMRSMSRSRYHHGWVERVRSCGGCKKRQAWVNRVVPYPRSRRWRRVPGWM